jgi:hypothetical protein
VPNRSYGSQFTVNFAIGFKQRRIDIYQSAFRWINELKVGKTYWGNELNPYSVAEEVFRDRYMITESPGPTSYWHPAGGRRDYFHVDGGTYWFRYQVGHGTPCQISPWNGLCPDESLRNELLNPGEFGPAMNIVYVFYYPHPDLINNVYKDEKSKIRAALESNDCPNQALDDAGLRTIKFPIPGEGPWSCSNAPPSGGGL